MTIIRQYILVAAPGREADLRAALVVLQVQLGSISGFVQARLLQDRDRPERHIFQEFWTSMEVYQNDGGQVPKAVFAPVMALLAGKPEASLLNDIALTP